MSHHPMFLLLIRFSFSDRKCTRRHLFVNWILSLWHQIFLMIALANRQRCIISFYSFISQSEFRNSCTDLWRNIFPPLSSYKTRTRRCADKESWHRAKRKLSPLTHYSCFYCLENWFLKIPPKCVCRNVCQMNFIFVSKWSGKKFSLPSLPSCLDALIWNSTVSITDVAITSTLRNIYGMKTLCMSFCVRQGKAFRLPKSKATQRRVDDGAVCGVGAERIKNFNTFSRLPPLCAAKFSA